MNFLPIVAALGAVGIAAIAYRLRALTVSGAVAASLVGFLCLAGGGPVVAAALLAFFATSTALSKWGKRRKDALGFEKGGRRDALQVLANGGVAATCAALSVVFPIHSQSLTRAALCALAAANADTWATEIGSLLGGAPVSLRTLRRARPGESGAISLAGTLASLAGASLIGVVALVFTLSPLDSGLIAFAGFSGALADSLLGAWVQIQYIGPDNRLTEQKTAPSGARNAIARGYFWAGNDTVNALATLAAALIGAFLSVSR